MFSPTLDIPEGRRFPLRTSWQPRPVPGRRALALSLTAHLAVAVLAWAPARRAPSPADPAACLGRPTTVPLAPPTRENPRERPPIQRRGGAPAQPFPSSAPAHVPVFDRVHIAVLPDHTRQLLPVLRRFDGRIALASTESPRSLLETFRARDFQPLGPTRLEDWLAFRLWDPEAWPELAPLLSRCPQDCAFYALFDPRYRFFILRAATAHSGPRRPIVKIVLRFDAASPSGIEVLSVECQPGSDGRKVFAPGDVSSVEGLSP